MNSGSDLSSYSPLQKGKQKANKREKTVSSIDDSKVDIIIEDNSLTISHQDQSFGISVFNSSIEKPKKKTNKAWSTKSRKSKQQVVRQGLAQRGKSCSKNNWSASESAKDRPMTRSATKLKISNSTSKLNNVLPKYLDNSLESIQSVEDEYSIIQNSFSKEKPIIIDAGLSTFEKEHEYESCEGYFEVPDDFDHWKIVAESFLK